MSNEEIIDNRLQPVHVNNLYHNFLNSSSLDLQNFILQVNNNDVFVVNNDNKTRTVDEINEELFQNKIKIVKNEEEVESNGIIIFDIKLIEDDEIRELFQQSLNVLYALINIIGKILNLQKPEISDFTLIGDRTDFENAKTIFNFAVNLTEDQKQVVRKFNKYDVYTNTMIFDMIFNAKLLYTLINDISQINFVDDNIESDDNIYTENESLAYGFLKSYDITKIFQLYNLHFFNLLDAVLYDDNLEKKNRTLNANGNKLELKLKKINDIYVHEVAENTNLILDKFQFIHLFDLNECDADEEYEKAKMKIAMVVTRGFYDDNDGTKIFTNTNFASEIKNILQRFGFIKYEVGDLNFESQYNDIKSKSSF
jgi:hypothetical protein